MRNKTSEVRKRPWSTSQKYLWYVAVLSVELATLSLLLSVDYTIRKWATAYVVMWVTSWQALMVESSVLPRFMMIAFQTAVIYRFVQMMEPPLNLAIFKLVGDPIWVLAPALLINCICESLPAWLKLAILTAIFPVWTWCLFWAQFFIASCY